MPSTRLPLLLGLALAAGVVAAQDPAPASTEADRRAEATYQRLKTRGPQALAQAKRARRLKTEAQRLRFLRRLVELDLSKLPDAVAVPLLEDALLDPSVDVRILAVERLATRSDARSIAAVTSSLSDPSLKVVKAAASPLYQLAQIPHRARSIPAAALTRAVAQRIDQARSFAAQIALRFLQHGGQLPPDALARLLGDPHPLIRGYQVEGKGWGNWLLDRVQRTPCTATDVAAIASQTHHVDEHIRIQAYQVLAEAKSAPGRGRLLARGLDDRHPTIRQECAAWLKPARGPDLLDPPAIREAFRIATGGGPGRDIAGTIVNFQIKPRRLARALVDLLTAKTPAALRDAAGNRLQALTNVPYRPGQLRRFRSAIQAWLKRREAY